MVVDVEIPSIGMLIPRTTTPRMDPDHLARICAEVRRQVENDLFPVKDCKGD